MPERYDGLTLPEANLRKKYGVNVVTIRRPTVEIGASPDAPPAYQVAGTLDPEFKLQKGDRLIVFGTLKDIDLLCQSND